MLRRISGEKDCARTIVGQEGVEEESEEKRLFATRDNLKKNKTVDLILVCSTWIKLLHY